MLITAGSPQKLILWGAITFCVLVFLVFPRLNVYTGLGTYSWSTHQKPDISRFHLLILGSGSQNINLCRLLFSAIALRYPVPTLIGWKAKGKYDAAQSHLAKVYAVLRYLEALPASQDDDLVLLLDGYDIFLQLPPDVMIQRYFNYIAQENERWKSIYGAKIAGSKDIRTSVIFGSDKLCWPRDWRFAACWAVPESPLPEKAFGEMTDVVIGDMPNARPRWLNSGTVMGPVSEMRDVFKATQERINQLYDPNFEFHNSDQFYFSEVWGDQEFMRTKVNPNGRPPRHPKDDGPRFEPDIHFGQRTEYHIGLEYTSGLFQSNAGYDTNLDWMAFNGSEHDVELPPDVEASMRKLATDLKLEPRPEANTQDVVRSLNLGTNFITKQVFGLFHCTGGKWFLDGWWHRFWYFGYGKPLLYTSAKLEASARPLSHQMIDGRRWITPGPLGEEPDVALKLKEKGGAWRDQDAEWLPWDTMCLEHEKILWSMPEEPKEEEKPKEEAKPKEAEKPKEEAKPTKEEEPKKAEPKAEGTADEKKHD